MKLTVRGIGWLDQDGYGSIRTGVSHPLNPQEGSRSLAKQGIFPRPFKNFGRMDAVSQLTAGAVALALQDAGVVCGPEAKADIGILGICDSGSLVSDLAYFRDYLDNGRSTSRGNLFVYTLPSSPLGEAAIYFGLTGPLLYLAGGERPLGAALEQAGELIASGETGGLLVGQVSGATALYFFVGPGERDDSFCDLREARAIVASEATLAGMVGRFSSMQDRIGVT